jgi:hypothetical protein
MKKDRSIAISFASAAEGRRILSRRDDFVRRLSPFDRAARLKTDRDVSQRQYLEFVRRNVRGWDAAERQKTASAFRGVRKKLEATGLPLPKNVLMVKTTGKEEGGAAYTRANAIVFPGPMLKQPKAVIQKIVCHELFHVASRANPGLRERLYGAIGFQRCGEAEFPRALRPRKLTNPDAPRNDHFIRVKVDGRERRAVPVLFADSAKYDTARGGEFFNYLRFKLLLAGGAKAIRRQLVDLSEVTGFFEQVGKNTGYIIHPEEILADNFALMVMQKPKLPTPEVIERIRAALGQGKSRAHRGTR